MPSASWANRPASWALFCVPRCQCGGPGPDRLGEQQLPTRRCDHLAHRPDGALVGDGELAQLGDLVAPQLDAHRVLGGGREDVHDATPDGELTARGDHVDPDVGQFDQPVQQAVEVVGGADPQLDRLQLAETGRDRLDQAAHRRGDHP